MPAEHILTGQLGVEPDGEGGALLRVMTSPADLYTVPLPAEIKNEIVNMLTGGIVVARPGDIEIPGQ